MTCRARQTVVQACFEMRTLHNVMLNFDRRCAVCTCNKLNRYNFRGRKSATLSPFSKVCIGNMVDRYNFWGGKSASLTFVSSAMGDYY